MPIIFSRVWCMPTRHTFDMKPVTALLYRYINSADLVIDPFAKDSTWGTRTNDLNPNSKAQHHMDCEAFVAMCVSEGDRYDVVLLDPPYSARQVKECYDGYGRDVVQRDTQVTPMLNVVKDACDEMLRDNGIVISFGWSSSVGMGIGRGYDIIEIMLVAHGGGHNDTIVTVERKRSGCL